MKNSPLKKSARFSERKTPAVSVSALKTRLFVKSHLGARLRSDCQAGCRQCMSDCRFHLCLQLEITQLLFVFQRAISVRQRTVHILFQLLTGIQPAQGQDCAYTIVTWRDKMSTGLHYLDLGIGIAVFVGIFWWMFALSTKSKAERKLEMGGKKITGQPWGDDKSGGRGNR